MGRHAADAPPSRPTGALAALVVLALVVVAALATGGIWLSRRDSTTPVADALATTTLPSATPTCATTPTPVAVAVAPAALTVVRQAAARTTTMNPCQSFTVTSAESADEAATLSRPGDKPAAWVSDSSVFLDAVRGAAPDVLAADVRPIATSPLVFALPSAVATAAGAALADPSWSTLVSGDPAQSTVPVKLTDPEHSTSGRLVLLNASSAIPSTPATRLALGKVLLTWSHTAMRSEQDLLAAAVTGSPGLVPTSEQAVAATLRAHPGSLVAVVPQRGHRPVRLRLGDGVGHQRRREPRGQGLGRPAHQHRGHRGPDRSRVPAGGCQRSEGARQPGVAEHRQLSARADG